MFFIRAFYNKYYEHDSTIWFCRWGLSFNQVKLVPNLGKVLWSLIKNLWQKCSFICTIKWALKREILFLGKKWCAFQPDPKKKAISTNKKLIRKSNFYKFSPILGFVLLFIYASDILTKVLLVWYQICCFKPGNCFLPLLLGNCNRRKRRGWVVVKERRNEIKEEKTLAMKELQQNAKMQQNTTK